MSSMLPFDPMQISTELVTLGVFVFVLFVLYWKRDVVMYALTGDTHIHSDLADCVWWCMKCGDTCTGDWTRCLTSCSWCPKRVRGSNLVTFFGQTCGLVSKTVEVKNLVVGDLPYQGRGDFFVNIECMSNPDICTSVMENKYGKVVHFPEILTLRAKQGLVGGQIRITVKEVRTFGFEELCEIFLESEQVMDWREDEEPKRFAMKVLTQGLVPETPPWIVLEFGHPTEARDIDHMHGSSYVRTITRDGHTQNNSIQDFKTSYSLVDATGHNVNEVEEADLGQVRHLRMCLSWVVWIVHTLIFLGLSTFSIFRFYLWSCYRQFYALTQAKLNNRSFPLSSAQLKNITKDCDNLVKGAGYEDGNHPCRPSHAQINGVCHAPPPGQPVPGAGRWLVETNLHISFHGLQCYSPPMTLGVPIPVQQQNDTGNWFGNFIDAAGGVCEIRQVVQPWDNPAYFVAASLVVVTICCQFAANSLIRMRRNTLANKSNTVTKNMQTQIRTQRAGASRSTLLG